MAPTDKNKHLISVECFIKPECVGEFVRKAVESGPMTLRAKGSYEVEDWCRIVWRFRRGRQCLIGNI